MPELPEVETVKKTLQRLIVGKTIADVAVRWPNIIKHPDDVQAFRTLLIGETIQDIARRGKFLRFILDRFVLVSHLRMEGKYRWTAEDEPLDKHTHVIFTFTDGSQLRYRDVRKFGTMHVYEKGEELCHPPLGHLGPEPLSDDFDAGVLQAVFQKTTRIVKAVLLDQTVVCGLGNIYVDEALFRAGIHPQAPANALTVAQMATLASKIRETLSEAVDMGGSSVRSYLNGLGEMGMFQQRLYVYGRTGEPCKRCGAPIEKMRAAGRGTHYCPRCQKKATA